MQIIDYFLSRYQNVIIFDVETTGLNFVSDDVIEFACVCLNEPNTIKSYDWLIKVDKSLPYNIVNLTHITNKMLQEKGHDRKLVIKHINDAILQNKKTLLIAHNANFDLNFLRSMFIKERKRLNWDNIDVLDTLTILRDRKPYPHKLSDAISFYGLDNYAQNTHRAIDDAKATFLVFKKMCMENFDIPKYINLFGYNPKYGIKYQERLPRVTYISQPYDNTLPLYQINEVK